MFFKDKADPSPPPFYLGWAQQWREGDCDWHAQRKKAGRKLDIDRTEMQAHVLKKVQGLRRKDNSRFKMNPSKESEEPVGIASSSVDTAPATMRENIILQQQKDSGIGGYSSYEKARDRVDTLFKKTWRPPKI